MRMVCIVFLVFGTVRLAMGQASASATVENHIHQVIESLPPSSQIRHELENGARGDGVHYPWMDEMRRQGIKRALVVIRFEWRRHPIQMSVVKTLYFDSYDTDCEQITAQAKLDKIQESRLPQMLQSYAMSQTERSHWFSVDQKIRGKHGQSNVELLDDEWLPRHPPLLRPNPHPL